MAFKEGIEWLRSKPLSLPPPGPLFRLPSKTKDAISPHTEQASFDHQGGKAISTQVPQVTGKALQETVYVH